MRQVTLALALLISYIANSMAQIVASSPITQQFLMSHKWYPNIYEEEDLETSFITYTLTQEVDSTFTEDGEIELYICNYYLSDTADTTFDTNKVGNSISGRYLIRERGTENDSKRTYVYEILFFSEEKMIVKHSSKGYTTYGHTMTLYTAPFR